ncbi:MAG: acetoacetate--CoA ligase [Gammaproteobacteria bacterium]|nr:acetoacetate--CoA ligase [Gammaproteobacteria bacterium]MDE0251874.1 acetoacetate--CoA ligase [Gammaproteobacteria bacterium]MDE0403117.1 acetoacetate--CoA ligase [Gammaproteobacteria bacterium]
MTIKNQEKPLWIPSQTLLDTCHLTRFAEQIKFDSRNYWQLHEWSVENRESFWNYVWDYAKVIGTRGDQTLIDGEDMLHSEWFPNAKLNFAENLLWKSDDQPAIITVQEGDRRTVISYRELQTKVAQFASVLSQHGIQTHDRVAVYLPNVAETVVAMLATTSLGAIWSSCSPDFGFQGALDRFSQIHPKVLIACEGYFYNGKYFDVSSNVQKLHRAIPSVEQVLTLNLSTNSRDDFDRAWEQHTTGLNDFTRFPFNHPLYIMFSSGTTGKPKCIVHGAGGTLLQHLKEHQLHTNINGSSRVFFFTTCGWMMWNWLVSVLASGATMILYDGSPTYPAPDRLMRLIEEEKITEFGAGAKYYSTIQKLNVIPKNSLDLSYLKVVLSTGSPLAPDSFDYIYRDIKSDLQLASIAGGTDIVSCFVLGIPWLPVFRGQIQGPGLGMDVKVFNEHGESVQNQKGELVCTRSFPSQPISFWNDKENAKYKSSYFERFDNVWAHGDYAELDSDANGMVIHGRSDAVLNPGGVRIGTSEIYRQVESMSEIIEAICVGQKWESDERVVLFVVVTPNTTLDDDLINQIKRRIRLNTTPRHVPALVLEVSEVPKTRSGKVAELAVRETIHGNPVENTSALANPECLEQFERWAAEHST